MRFEQLNPAACRTYLISDGSDAVLVDPVIVHVADYLKRMKDDGLVLTHVIDTHTHADHISAGPALREATGCEYVMHQLAPAKCVTVRVMDGDEIVLAGQKIKVIQTPGHTRDSISLLMDGKLLSGDFLFLEDAGAGRDDLPGGSPQAHWHSLQKLKPLPGDLMVYPAHEYRDRVPTTLENQRSTNPHLKDMSENDFVTYINDLKLGPADWMKDVLTANYQCSTDPNAAYIPDDTAACEIKGTMDPNAKDIPLSFINRDGLTGGGNQVLVDVRERDELTGPLGHIDGIIHIPIGQLSQRISELAPHKDKQIVTVCRSGARASTAAQILTAGGFDDVKILAGGMIEYNKQ